jgi:hypothetical protein
MSERTQLERTAVYENPEWASRVALLLAGALLGGCASRARIEPTAVQSMMPVAVNHTPFSATVALAADDAGNYFYSATQKVTFQLAADGSTRFAQRQEPLSVPSRALSASCSDVRACVVPSDLGPFRRRAEIYLDAREGVASSDTWVSVDGRRCIVQLVKGQAVFAGVAETFLVPYPTAGSRIIVGDAPGPGEISFNIPNGFYPFVLVRYRGDELVPVPARADTLVIDPRGRRMTVVYRSTLAATPEIQKIEFRALVPPGLSKTKWIPWRQDGTAAIVRYISQCPIPTDPVEPCSGLRPSVDPEVLSAAVESLFDTDDSRRDDR